MFDGWWGWQRRILSLFFSPLVHKQSNDVIHNREKLSGLKNTLCQHNSKRTPKKGFCSARERKIFAYSQTMSQRGPLNPFFLPLGSLSSSDFFYTTHAQILLSLRWNIILFYLNLASEWLREREWIHWLLLHCTKQQQQQQHLKQNTRKIFRGWRNMLSGSWARQVYGKPAKNKCEMLYSNRMCL